MGLLHRMETELERQIPAQLQANLQQALDDYQHICDHCHHTMHRHHRYARSVNTNYGEIRLRIPVFRCRPCRRMGGGMTLLGDEMRYQRFSPRQTGHRHQPGGARIELRPRRQMGRLRQKHRLQVGAEDDFEEAGIAAGWHAGTGRSVDENP